MSMIQFNIHRFAKLARWSLTNDKKYYVKSFLQTLVILVLVFLFFTVATVTVNGHSGYFHACVVAVLVTFLVTIVLGSSFMFHSMEGKHDMQALLMLPASNLEKYLMRYASWILLLPLYLVAFFAADLVQYVFNWVVGHEEVMFVTTALVDMGSDTWHKIPAHYHTPFALSMIFLTVWLNSAYALGATFFRSRKYNWVFSTIFIIMLTMLIPAGRLEMTDNSLTSVEILIGVVWILVNFWLSYRLFCRQQVIGKFVNV